MNQIQEAIARVTGLDEVVSAQESELQEIANVMEHLISDNKMLMREIEDMDYLNLYDVNPIGEVLPIRDRNKVIFRLRRLRHDNPLAKQAVKLTIRFTLGKGVQWVIAEPPKTPFLDGAPPEVDDSSSSNPNSGDAGATPERPPLGTTKVVQLPRAARRAEAVDVEEPEEDEEVDASDEFREQIEGFWGDSDNKLAFTTHKSMQRMLDDIITDGEKFYAAFEGSASPYVKVSSIPLEEVKQIIYNPDNRLEPVFYRRVYQPMEYTEKNGTGQYLPKGQPVTEYYWDYRIRDEEKKNELLKKIHIPTAKIHEARVYHASINEVETKDGWRGVSELYSSREWFRVFREFMEGRAQINSAAQAISFLRKIKGNPATVARFQGKLGALSTSDSDALTADGVRRLTRPVAGAIYDSNEGVDLEWMKTDTGAANAKEDARLILMSAGAGVGTNIHYFGEGGDANLATAQAMELPMVKSYEDWQQWIEDFFLGWFWYVIVVANPEMQPEEVDSALQRIGFSFPPIISEDIVKYTTSWAQVVRDIAPNNMAVRREAIRAALGAMKVPNLDGLMPEIEAEMEHAEAQRLEQQRLMRESLANAGLAAAGGEDSPRPPVAGRIPNQGLDPNTKKIAAGRGVKAANGPREA